MPLTFSHPAASVPWRHFGLKLSPLVVGSMAPDFAKFATLSPATNFGHTWPGIFWFCVPCGLIALLIFHALIKQPLFAMLPFTHQKRLVPILNRFSFTPAKEFLVIIVSLIVGAFTHLAWDSFTHKNELTENILPLLNKTIFVIRDHPVRFYKLLQHGSTIGGFASLIFWYSRWFNQAPEHNVDSRFLLSAKAKIILWLTMLCVALGAGMAYGLIIANQHSGIKAFKIFLGRSVVASGALFGILLLIFCIVLHRKNHRLSQQND